MLLETRIALVCDADYRYHVGEVNYRQYTIEDMLAMYELSKMVIKKEVNECHFID